MAKRNIKSSKPPPPKSKQMPALKKSPAKARALKRHKHVNGEVDDKISKISAQPSKKRKIEKSGQLAIARPIIKKENAIPTLEGDKAGLVLVCGFGDAGQLGLGKDVPEKVRPALLELPFPVVDIAAGGLHTLLLTKDGQVYSFGCNDDGALGRPSTDETEGIPGLVHILDKANNPVKIVQISAGDSHSAALSTTGQVYAWGNFRDSNGLMGLLPGGKGSPEPVLVLGAPHFVTAIASGDNHLVCRTSTGQVYSCGSGEQGQLGRVSDRHASRISRHGSDHLLEPQVMGYPRKIKGQVMRFKTIWTGSFVTLGANQLDLIYGTGLNNFFQLGHVDPNKQLVYYPKNLVSFNGIKWQSISGGQHHTLSLSENGKVYVTGRKEYGRLGLGADSDDQKAPTIIPALQDKTCVSIAAGEACSYAVTNEGELYAWGQSGPNLGLGDVDDDALEPTLVRTKALADKHVVKVAAGGQHLVLLAYSKDPVGS